jgi:hypothetical protein
VMAKLPVTLPLALGENITLKLTLWPAVSVVGKAKPLRLNPEPVTLAEEIATLVPPELVRVSVSEPLLPVVTLPRLRLAWVGVSWPGAMPVPVSGTFRVEFEALDAMAKLPVTAPPAVGENFVLKLTLWPAVSVVGKLKPLTLNPEPVVPAAEIVMLVPPELVRVSVREPLLPVVTLPKPRLVGVEVSWPELTPVPDTGTVTV